MEDAGRISMLILLHAGIPFEAESVNVPQCKESSLLVMVMFIAKLLGFSAVKLTMEDVGRILVVAGLTLLVWTSTHMAVNVHQDSEVMEFAPVKILMSARRKWPVNAQSAIVRTLGAVMSAVARMACCTCKNMIYA